MRASQGIQSQTADFIQDLHPRSNRVISTENIIQNRIRAQMSTAAPKYSADLRPKYNVPSSALLSVTHSFVAIHLYTCVTRLSNCDMSADKAYRKRQCNFGRRLIKNYA